MGPGQEPRDGDFVAYLEQLQRESAARLAAGHAPMAGPVEAAAHAPGAASAPALTRQQAEALRARLAGGNREIVPAMLLAIGLVVFLGGFLVDGGFASLVVGLGLIIWSLNRLARLRAQRAAAASPGGSA
jgi:hypothetical protein